MIKGGTGGANTVSGAYFEQITHGEAPGIPLHKAKLRKHYEEKTHKLYALSKIFSCNTGLSTEEIPKDKWERANKFEGQYLLTKALEPDEAYLDYETSTLTIFEKKYQDTDGSVDEKIQTIDYKMKQYKRIAAELGIENVYFVYILGDFFKNPYYRDSLEYIRSIPNCDYFFANDN
jgi:hypothetical protein